MLFPVSGHMCLLQNPGAELGTASGFFVSSAEKNLQLLSAK